MTVGLEIGGEWVRFSLSCCTARASGKETWRSRPATLDLFSGQQGENLA